MGRFSGSLDANVILRVLIRDIPAQAAIADNLLNSVVNGPQLAVADTAIIETAFVMGREYGLARGDIVRLLTAFMLLPQVNCNRVLFDEAFQYFVASPAQTLEDCCLAVYAKNNQAEPLYTLDKKLAKQVPYAKLLA